MSSCQRAIVKAGAACSAIVVCLVLASMVGERALLGAQSTTAPQQAADPNRQERPTFTSDVRLIDVDVFVTDKDGRFVRGLTRDDFELVEEGTPQTIAAFSFIDLQVQPPAPAAANQADEPEPDVTTNTTREGRIYVFLMDAPSSASGGRGDYYVKQYARQFIEDAMAPGDVAGVVHVNGTFSDAQTFTTSKRLLLNAVDRYRGMSGPLTDLSARRDPVELNLATYRAMQDLSERLGAMSGRRKTILWVGGQIEFDPATLGCVFDLSPPPGVDCRVGHSAAVLLTAYRDTMSAATRNNVTIHPIDTSGLTTTLGIGELKRTSALRMVAEDTGGIAVVGTNNIGPLFQAIVRDSSTYYVLGYVPSTPHRDGKFHSIRVQVKRPGLTVRARKGYYAPAPDATARVPLPLPDGVSVAARDALRMPVSVRGLAIDLFAAPFKVVGRDTSVVIGGQITGDLRLGSGDRVALSYQVFTIENQLHTGEYKVFTLDLQPRTRADAEEAGLRFVDRIVLPPGRYELRLVADQPGGSTGSVVIPLEVPAFDDALSLSGVLLAATSTAGHRTLLEDTVLRDALGSDPTAVRRFVQGDVLTAFAEVYVKDGGPDDEVTVTGTLSRADGGQVKQEIGALSPSEPPGATAIARRSVTIELTLSDVPPGLYVLTVEAASARDTRRTRRIPLRIEE